MMMVMLGFGRSDCVGAPRPGVHEWGKKESFKAVAVILTLKFILLKIHSILMCVSVIDLHR